MSASQSRRITARKIASGELSWTTDISRPPLTAADSSDALAPDDLMNHADSKSGSIKPMGTSIDLEQVLLEQLPSVRSIARGIHNRLPQQVPIDDLIQAGILGL